MSRSVFDLISENSPSEYVKSVRRGSSVKCLCEDISLWSCFETEYRALRGGAESPFSDHKDIASQRAHVARSLLQLRKRAPANLFLNVSGPAVWKALGLIRTRDELRHYLALQSCAGEALATFESDGPELDTLTAAVLGRLRTRYDHIREIEYDCYMLSDFIGSDMDCLTTNELATGSLWRHGDAHFEALYGILVAAWRQVKEAGVGVFQLIRFLKMMGAVCIDFPQYIPLVILKLSALQVALRELAEDAHFRCAWDVLMHLVEAIWDISGEPSACQFYMYFGKVWTKLFGSLYELQDRVAVLDSSTLVKIALMAGSVLELNAKRANEAFGTEFSAIDEADTVTKVTKVFVRAVIGVLRSDIARGEKLLHRFRKLQGAIIDAIMVLLPNKNHLELQKKALAALGSPLK